MKKALITINSLFPTGQAISSRMLNFCRLIRDIGYSVDVIASNTADQNIIPGQTYGIEDITYQVVYKGKPSSVNSFIGDSAFLRQIERYLKNNPVDFVFLTSSNEMFFRLKHIFHKYSVKYILEQCECLDVATYRFGYYDIRFIKANYLYKKGFFHPNGIVSISNLLNNHFLKFGINTIRIPTILDVQKTNFVLQKSDAEKIHIVFAGSIGGKKELMKPIIEALAQNECFRKKFVFDIYGPTYNQLLQNLDGESQFLMDAGDCIIVHGRIPQEHISEVYLKSDFSVFLRPDRKSSNAGFPTKLAESMAAGTPVISNATGDIGLYLKNMINGFLLRDNSREAVEECFSKIISMNKADYEQMRNNARLTAERDFDYRNYMHVFTEFIKNL